MHTTLLRTKGSFFHKAVCIHSRDLSSRLEIAASEFMATMMNQPRERSISNGGRNDPEPFERGVVAKPVSVARTIGSCRVNGILPKEQAERGFAPHKDCIRRMPRSPPDYNESFIGSLRDELLNGEIFCSLAEAKVLIEGWRRYYNTVRPHSSLGYRPPLRKRRHRHIWPPVPLRSTYVRIWRR